MKTKLLLSGFFTLLPLTSSCSSDNNTASPIQEEQNINLSTTTKGIQVGTIVHFKVLTDDNKEITDATITSVETNKKVGYQWIPEREGTYNFIATKTGFKKSTELTIKVFPIDNQKNIQGTFIVQGESYNIDSCKMKYEGKYQIDNSGDYFLGWIIYAEDSDKKASALPMFFTPMTQLENGKISTPYPNSENITNSMLSVWVNDREVIYLNKGVQIDLSLEKFNDNYLDSTNKCNSI
ncbi:hypothetical protein VSO92_09885 [Myroides pelagicus]|uniref:hypothetical protein n=1 Tax=Myroides pelagicus TaxID=270914 RepID=UPI002DB982CE|nr:hypothetical protein [Myroides pelagicus]MEC4114417.1 hypothetical protein [Myroides pelagicus]